MAKFCEDCNKVFSFFEKIYTTDDNRKICVDCVQKMNEKSASAVGLSDGPLSSGIQMQQQEYISLTTESKSTKEWEFRVAKLNIDPADLRKGAVTIERFENTINKMGEDGWELVSVVPLSVMLMREVAPQPAMIFKRLKN